MRFSSTKYSFRVKSSPSTEPVMQATKSFQSMNQSESAITPAIKVWFASKVVVNQLIGFFGPYDTDNCSREFFLSELAK